MLSFVQEQWTFGETPRNFNIEPGGNYMYVGHQNTDNLVVFKVDKATGKLEYTGQQLVSAGQPVCIIFHTAPQAGNSVKDGVTFWSPNDPIFTASNGAGRATLAWNAPGVGEVDLRIGSPDGVSMGRHHSYGTTTTGDWASAGLTFYLQDVSGGRPLTAENTLGVVRIHSRA
jgi:hypothetical protein